MKKLAVLTVLIAILMFAVATNALAATVYLDYMVDGKSELSGGMNATHDADVLALGFELPLKKFIVGMTYIGITDKAPTGDSDSYTLEVRGGYQLVKTNPFTLYGLLAIEESGGDNDVSYCPIVGGIKGVYDFNKKMYLEGEFFLITLGNEEFKMKNFKTDMDFSSYLVRFNYRITDGFIVFLGHNGTKLSCSAFDSDTSGIIVGGGYKF